MSTNQRALRVPEQHRADDSMSLASPRVTALCQHRRATTGPVDAIRTVETAATAGFLMAHGRVVGIDLVSERCGQGRA